MSEVAPERELTLVAVPLQEPGVALVGSALVLAVLGHG